MPSLRASEADLVGFWRRHRGFGFHSEDEAHIAPSRAVAWTPKQAVAHAWDFRSEAYRSKFHRNLIPIPFAGHIETAKVFVLMLNPGLNVTDYLEDHHDPIHRAHREANLRQRLAHCPLLNPALVRSGGYQYWSRWFLPVIRETAADGVGSLAVAAKTISKSVAILQAYPYHSVSDPGAWARKLPSAQKMRTWVQASLLKRARTGGALIVVVRAARFWGLAPEENVLVRPENRGRLARFTLDERNAIVEALERLGP